MKKLAILFLGLCVLGFIAVKAIQLVLLYIYKIMRKHYNTVKNYNGVHTKLDVKDYLGFAKRYLFYLSPLLKFSCIIILYLY